MKLTGRRQSRNVVQRYSKKETPDLYFEARMATGKTAPLERKRTRVDYSKAGSKGTVDNLRYSQRAANMDSFKRDLLNRDTKTRDAVGKIKNAIAVKSLKDWYKRNKK